MEKMSLIGENTILTSKLKIPQDRRNDFADWQAKLNAMIAATPGFISLEIISPTDTHLEWVIVQRFEDETCALTWKDSSARQELIADLKRIYGSEISSEIHEEMSSIGEVQGGVTEVFVTQVSSDKEMDYRKWIAKIHQIEAKFPGFRGVYVQAPHNGERTWITLLQFDTIEHLDKWIMSEERKEILAESKELIASLESHRMFSPYAGWFKSIEQTTGQVPAIWKQTMIVLLVLFPLVMLEFKFLNPFLTGLNISLATFIGNAISVSLVAWPMVPLVIRYLSWWLVPQGKNQLLKTVAGTLLVLIFYLIEILTFWDIL
jgi:antibiotic biosynthesis monooxygenase (ABM) superfamily enzyme